MNGLTKQQEHLPASRQENHDLQQRYGNRSAFLRTFNPDLQLKICMNSEECFFGDYPTLAHINRSYGEMSAAMWLVPQLYDLSEYSGCKGNMSQRQYEQCASVIATEFSYLKVSEIMLFFVRFKSGRYGRFYGNVDPLVITTSIRVFLTERMYELDIHEQKERQEQRELEMKDAVSREEHEPGDYKY